MVTAEELRDLAYLPREIDGLDLEICQLTRPPSFPMTRTQGRDYAAAVGELIGILEDRRQNCAALLERLHEFINGIDDDFVRELFRLRYECGNPWPQVWEVVTDMGYMYEPESLRRMCDRYLNRCGG